MPHTEPNQPNKFPQNQPVDPLNRPATIPRVPNRSPEDNSSLAPTQSPSKAYPPTTHAPQQQPTTYPQQVAPPPSKGIGRTLLQMLGWTLLFAAIMIALVVGSGLWTARTVTRDLVNPNTRTTVVTKGPVVASIRQVNKQIMVEHNNMVYIDYREAPEGWLQILPIEQSFVVLLRGQVPAGFELDTLSDEDIWISEDGSKVRLTLPPPTIFEENVSVDFAESRIIAEGDSCPDFICATDLDALQESVMPQARPMLIEASRESGIVEQTAQLGVAYYESLLRALGFDEVQVIIRAE